MSFKDKLKKFINVTDEDYIDSEEKEYDEGFDYTPNTAPAAPVAQSQPMRARTDRAEKASSSNVVNINNAGSKPAAAVQGKPHVVFQKIDRFEDVGSVADVLNEKRIVILNLETCPNDVSQRIIDFLYGVAYANHGDFKKVAGRAYIITPYNIPVSGELLDEINSNPGFNQ